MWLVGTELAVTTASGRGDPCYEWICFATKPGTTFEELADSGQFASIDSKLMSQLFNMLKDNFAREVLLVVK